MCVKESSVEETDSKSFSSAPLIEAKHITERSLYLSKMVTPHPSKCNLIASVTYDLRFNVVVLGGESDCESDCGGDVPDVIGVHSGDWPRHHRFLLHVS